MKKVFNKAIRILLATNGLVLTAGAMLGPIYALFVEDIGGNLLNASLAAGIFALTAGLTTLLAGRYFDKAKHSEFIIIFGYGLIGIGFLLYTIVNSLLFLFIIEAFIGIAEALYSPAFDALYSKHLNLKKAGREWGAWEATNYFTAAIGAIIGGLIVTQFGFDVLFYIMALLTFTSAIYIYKLPRRIL